MGITALIRLEVWRLMMGTCLRKIGFLAAVLSLFVFPAHVPAQTDNDESYKAERQKAIELFNQNKHLEALPRSEEHTSELQSQSNLVCRLLLEKKKKDKKLYHAQHNNSNTR